MTQLGVSEELPSEAPRLSHINLQPELPHARYEAHDRSAVTFTNTHRAEASSTSKGSAS
jgi:hypothetical protein